ncbi:agmatine deiminase family protein [Maricaulis sp.]|uniref:agmatine deiminase family protein n=1 Tax=Maricaulis sp. TaxID=1486257 RepID=UPI00343DE328
MEDETVMQSERELIVVAAPRYGDPYYADVAAGIFEFHVAYAQAVQVHDDFLVLADARSAPAYIAALGPERVAIAPQDDIWMRDFSLSNANAPVMFRYTAEGQGGGRDGQDEADHVQEELAGLMQAAGLDFTESDWLNDGGNFVDDYADRAVLSRKFLRDNALTEAQGRALLQQRYGLEHVAFIEADEQGGLEHADGVVAFIDANTLVINAYPEDPAYADALVADLRAGLPGVTIHIIVTPYDGSDIYDERFGSACGLYTNMLVTPDRIYLPQFGIAEDAEALAAVRSWTDKTVVPVQSGQVCAMGGGVRCMSWQLRGENAARLRAWAAQR